LGSAGAIARLPVIPEIERLVILVDHDNNGVGAANARECAQRWTAADRTVVLLTPCERATDFNDLIRSENYEAGVAH
jgi:phage/plasmid primase-like uncharacterized protein